MKYELLKRTAIALFVGSVISTYSVAEGSKLSENSSLKDVTNAINKNGENIKTISKLLIGDETDSENPGLIDTINTINKQATDNANLLITMAGKVDQNKKDTDAELAKKADKATVDAELAKRADKATVDAELAKKADKATVDAELAKRADKATVDAELAKKADKATVDAELAKRADKSTVDAELAKRADKAAVDAELAKKADKTTVEQNTKEIEKIKNLEGYKSLAEVKAMVDDVKEYVDVVDSDVDELVEEHNELSKKHNTLVDKHNELFKDFKEFSDETNNKLNDKADKQALKDLSEGIRDNVLPAIEANRTDIDANKADVDTLKNKVAGAAAAVDLLTQNIALNKTNIESKADQDYVEGLERDVKANTSDIKDLSEGIRDNILPAIEANRTDIDANKADVDTLKNKVAGAAAAVDLLTQNIALNKTNIESKADQDYVEGLEQDVKINTQDIKDLSVGIRDHVLPAIEANRSDIDKNASHITDIRNKQALQNARLDNHGERIDANKAEIAKKANQTDVDANKAAIAKKANQTDVDANKAEIAKKANQTDVDANKAEIAKKADKTELATKADKNSVYSKSETDEKFALKADNSVVRAQATDISNLRTDVNAHKVDIDKLRTDVNTHTKRLDHLDNRVNKLDKDLKRGLAAQAALTGLFQPYTVGKANFTAAVGGYKSQTAVAIGTGYRYNQNIATKAGVAFTQGGGVTYNAGVNFEW